MIDRLIVRPLGLLLVVAALFLAPVSRAQDDSEVVKGIDAGNYNVQQSVELGYRGTWIDGNQDTYGTFVNLRTGPRVLDYSLHMRSLNHQGLLFDRLDFTNFGYGGDPDNASRLRADKNKWFDFSLVFRRHKNFWDYNLLANPLNPVPIMPTAGNPLTFPITNPVYPVTRSPHSLELVRRMQDYDLTLLPQSRVRFRLGYSRDVNEGPSLTSFHGTTDFLLAQNFRMTTNAYHVGVDFRFLPKTTISYDQFLEYNKQDTVDTLADTPFTVSTATYPPVKVDMGLNWYYPPMATTTPCAAPFLSTGYANPGCKQYVSYSRTAPARNFLPTERVSLQSTYFTNFEMSGSASYSASDNKIKSLYDIANEWTNSATSAIRNAIVMGPARAKEVFVHANWSGVYSVTEKVRVRDSVRYDNWRSQGLFNNSSVNLFAVSNGTYNILSPVAAFAPLAPAGSSAPTFTTICPSPYTAVTCPQHTASSSFDYSNTLYAQFLGQRLISNTVQVEADFTRRISGRIGYMYEDRTIGEFELDNAITGSVGQLLGVTYYPGGSTATAANDYLAARGNCPLVAGVITPVAGGTCSAPSATDGSITWTVDPAQLSAELATPRDTNMIHGGAQHVGLAGVTLRPMDTLLINTDFQFGYSDYAATRIWPRQIQSYKVHAEYTPRPWWTVDAAVDIHENRDNVSNINNLEHGRTYSVTTVLAPNPKLAYTLGYNFTDLSAQAFVCFRDTFGTMTNVGSGTALPTFAACPAAIFDPAVPAINLGATAFYTNKQHYAYSDVMWKPTKKVTTRVGYSGAFAGGSTLFLNPLQPAGTLAFTYQKPFASVEFNASKGLSYKVQWNYYGYNSKTPMNVNLPVTAVGFPNPSNLTLAPIPGPDFNGNAATFSVRYAF